MTEEALSAILNKYPFGTCLPCRYLGLFDLRSAIGELDSTLDSISHLESSSLVSTYDPLPSLASSPMLPYIVFPAKFELKPLCDSLKHVFLGLKETLLIII